ncbi:hypothetical protein HNY73_003074 [Argiope bruennichi]|uniref:Uncharacterized protein n=1 Tax=Argiope bruennichi TaxID=94029 RepID=A0A8T0FYD3_ARGBR|nr:hypothetical protein HNY73_003074 [Argiope bruennichi]
MADSGNGELLALLAEMKKSMDEMKQGQEKLLKEMKAGQEKLLQEMEAFTEIMKTGYEDMKSELKKGISSWKEILEDKVNKTEDNQVITEEMEGSSESQVEEKTKDRMENGVAERELSHLEDEPKFNKDRNEQGECQIIVELKRSYPNDSPEAEAEVQALGDGEDGLSSVGLKGLPLCKPIGISWHSDTEEDFVAGIADPCFNGLDFLQEFGFAADSPRNVMQVGDEESPVYPVKLCRCRRVLPVKADVLFRRSSVESCGQFSSVENEPGILAMKANTWLSSGLQKAPLDHPDIRLVRWK